MNTDHRLKFGKYVETLRRSSTSTSERLKLLAHFLILNENETHILYDMAAESRSSNDIATPQDCADYMLGNSYVIEALRLSMETGAGDAPYDLDGYLTEMDTGLIGAAYMNSRFDKYLKLINQPDISEDAVAGSLKELHRTFATLTQEEQRYAEFFLRDMQRGDANIESGKSLRDYIKTTVLEQKRLKYIIWQWHLE